MDRVDVVVVGGGIGGAALAAALAPSGLSVLVLERQVVHRDLVRGEYMHPWGVAEAQRLDLVAPLLAAGGGFCDAFVDYEEFLDPAAAEAAPIPLSLLLPGVDGAINVGHPQACEALSRVASDRGATVERGIGDVLLTTGAHPVVRYQDADGAHEVTCRLVIGADGRQSVVRRTLGIELDHQQSGITLGGLLVQVEGWASGSAALGTEGDVHFFCFPRPDGFVRLYLARQPGAATAGQDRERSFLEAFNLRCMPAGERLASGRPAGPCAYYPGSDAWTPRPLAPGVVLIGDAAGWSDPIIGEGLSIALRDARMVSEALLSSDDWSPGTFEKWVMERDEWMRRFRTIGFVHTNLRCTFTPQGQARRAAFGAEVMSNPASLGLIQAMFAGPENAPPEVFEEENVARILALA